MIWIAEWRKKGSDDPWSIYGDPMCMGWTAQWMAERFVRNKNEPFETYMQSDYEWRAVPYKRDQQ